LKIIDTHGHYGQWPFPIKTWEPEDIRRLFHRLGISKGIFSSSLGVTYDFREGNRELAEKFKGFPELLGYVTINPNYPGESIVELDRYLDGPTFVGVKLHCMYTGVRVNSIGTLKVLEKVAEKGVPILIHGSLTETMDACRKIPHLKVIMAHQGSYGLRGQAHVLADFPQIHFDFCSTPKEQGKLRAALDVVGADRILFGSDVTLINLSYVLGIVKDTPLSVEEKEKILYKNAQRLFGISA
jgi:predicted TIM-barrel fold metal-dependent hydrolase